MKSKLHIEGNERGSLMKIFRELIAYRLETILLEELTNHHKIIIEKAADTVPTLPKELFEHHKITIGKIKDILYMDEYHKKLYEKIEEMVNWEVDRALEERQQ